MHRPPSRGMNTDAQHRRLTTIALQAARMNGSMGGDFADYLGNFDHIEFKKSEAGDYRAVILGAEISLGAVQVEDAVRVHKRPRWSIFVRPETCKNRSNPFTAIRTEADGMPPISKTLREAKEYLFDYLRNSDGSEIWYW